MAIPRADSSSSNCATAGDISPSPDTSTAHSKFFSESSGDDAPLIERIRSCCSDLNERPMSDEFDCNLSCCNLSVRQWTAYDKMIVAMHQNAHHREFHASRRGSAAG